MRILRLIFGVGGLAQGIYTSNFVMLVVGGLLLVQGIFNVGCWGNACVPPPVATGKTDSVKDIEFEEIKS